MTKSTIVAILSSTALFGCQHHHAASTQIAVDQPRRSAQPAMASRVGNDAGHAVAVAGRETGHVAMQAARGTGDLFTKSAVVIRNTPPESLSAPSIDVDEAMQARDWDTAPAYYANGSTVAGPIGFILAPAPNRPQAESVVVEPALFGINTLIMPLDFFHTPPWSAVEWKAATVEPTYTGVPPLPPEEKP